MDTAHAEADAATVRSGRESAAAESDQTPTALFTVTVLGVDAPLPRLAPRKESTPAPTWSLRYQFWDESECAETAPAEAPHDGLNDAREFVRPLVDSFFQTMVATPLELTVLESHVPVSEKASHQPPKTVVGTARFEGAESLFWQGDIPMVDAWLPIVPAEGFEPFEAKVHVVLKANRPLVDEDDRRLVNVLSLDALGVYALPRTWVLREAQENPYAFSTRVFLPDSRLGLEIAGGSLVQPEAPAPSVQATDDAASAAPTAEPPADAGEAGGEPAEDADGDAAIADGAEGEPADAEAAFHEAREAEPSLRVEWPEEARTTRHFLSAAVVKQLKQQMDGQGLPLQLRRGFADPSEVDPNGRKYFGVAKLRLHDLLAPGTAEATVRAPLSTYTGTDPREFDDGRTPTPKRRAAKKVSKKKRPELEVEEQADMDLYAEAQTFVKVRFAFARPVIPALKKPKHVLKPRDIIPSRAMQAKLRTDVDATVDYQGQIQTLIEQLAEDYTRFAAANATAAPGDDGRGTDSGDLNAPSTKARFLHELNVNGKYFAFKDQLKRSVVRIVREKFHRTSSGSKEDFATFYNELYIYLVEHMHSCMNTVFAAKTAPVTKADTSETFEPVTVESLMRIATEAELKRDYALAARYHQDRVSRRRNDPDIWYDYAAFALRTDDGAKAEQCLREAIAIDGTHHDALVAYGALLLTRQDYDKAEVFLKGATDAHTQSITAWALRGILYDAMELEDESEFATKSASRARDAADEGARESINVHVARLLLELNQTQVAEKAISHELLALGPSLETTMLLGRMYALREDYARAEDLFQEAIKTSHTHYEAWRQLGHLYFVQHKFSEARSAYETAMSLTDSHPVAVLLRLAHAYFAAEMWTEAKDMFMQACRVAPTASSWLGVGMAFYRLQDYAHAEQALSEANILDNRRPEVWGFLTLVCLRTDRVGEADLSLKQAMRFQLRDAPLLAELGSVYLELGLPDPAEQCVGLSLNAQESSRARCILADILVAAGKTQRAKTELKAVVENYDTEQDRVGALKRLIAILEQDDASSAEAQQYQQLL